MNPRWRTWPGRPWGRGGVSGNKGTWPLIVLEHGNKRKINTGTRAYFREQGTPKSKKSC